MRSAWWLVGCACVEKKPKESEKQETQSVLGEKEPRRVAFPPPVSASAIFQVTSAPQKVPAHVSYPRPGSPTRTFCASSLSCRAPTLSQKGGHVTQTSEQGGTYVTSHLRLGRRPHHVMHSHTLRFARLPLRHHIIR